MLDSASAHAIIGVKDLSRAKEFYSDKLGLTIADELPAGAIRYAARGGAWLLVYQSQLAGTAKTTCMRSTTSRLPSASFGIAGSRSRSTTFRN